MKSLASTLAAAVLVLAAVFAIGAAADPVPQTSISKGVAVSKSHHRHHKHRHKKHHPGHKAAPEATPPPPSSPEPPGQLLFASNFDGSFRPWIDVQSLSARATINTAHPFAGSGAGRFEV